MARMSAWRQLSLPFQQLHRGVTLSSARTRKENNQFGVSPHQILVGHLRRRHQLLVCTRQDAVCESVDRRGRCRTYKQNICWQERRISGVRLAKAPVCSLKSGVDAGSKSSVLGEGAFRIFYDRQGAMVKRCEFSVMVG